MADAERCAGTIVATLVATGVQEVVLAPGSRSAPLAYALYAAEQAAALRLHVRIDERSAAFLALGLAKCTGTATAVVTTSGTAAANLYPAVLEAAHAGVPLIMITADRPAALAHSGANQTTDQTRLFGVHTRGFADLADNAADADAWQFQIERLIGLATGVRSRLPGPVQLNVAFSNPLAPAALPRGLLSVRPPVVVEGAAVADPTRLPAGPRTVIVAGDAAPAMGWAVADAAGRARVPLLAEPSSNARRGDAAIAGYRIVLSSTIGAEIERVIVFGHPTLSRQVGSLLSRPGVEVVVVSDRSDWVDPGRQAARVCTWVELEPADDVWLRRWQQADALVRTGLDDLLAAQPTLTGPVLAARLWSAMDGSGPLVVGSSNPIRDLDLAARIPDPPDVYANRGLAGIDGTVSTAVGVALGTSRPTHALLGDLTFLHDSNGVLGARGEQPPDLRLVVANDVGGSIFATLEHGEPALADAYERLFGTSQAVDLETLAQGFGAGYQRIDSASEVDDLLANPVRGLEVVEAVVDRRGRRALDAAITALAATL